MSYRSLNNLVACEPFAAHGIQKKVAASGLVMAENYASLTGLKVLADGPEDIRIGDIAFVPGKMNNQPWAKEVLERPDGVRFILVPVNHIAMYQRGSFTRPKPEPTLVPGEGPPVRPAPLRPDIIRTGP